MITIKQIILSSFFISNIIFSLNIYAKNYVEDAKQYITEGKHKAAIIQLKNQIQQKPYDSEARYLLGKLYWQYGQMKQADKELSKALELVPNDTKFTLAYAEIVLLKREYQKVINMLPKPYTSLDYETKRLELLANAYLGKNELEEAKKIFSSLANNEGSFAGKIGMGEIAMAEGNETEALELFDDALKVDPENEEALRLKAKIYTFKMQYDDAKKIYDRLIKNSKNSKHKNDFYFERAIIYIVKKDFDAAQKDIQYLMKENSSSALGNYLLSQIYLLNKDYTKAAEASQKVLVTHKHYPSMLISSIANLGVGNYNQAEKYVLQYLSNKPNNTKAQNLLANVYIAQKNGEQAILILEGISPDVINKNAGLLTTLGSAYLLVGEYEKGMGLLKQANLLAPENAFTRKKIIQEKYKSGEFESVISEIETLKQINTDISDESSYMLVLAYIQQKKLKQAKIKLTELIQKSPASPDLYNLQAIIYLIEGDKDKALSAYQKAVNADDKYITAFMGMAKIELSKNNYTQAKKYFSAVISIDDKNVRAYIALADIARKQGDLKSVETILSNAYQVNQADAQKQVQLATLLSNFYISQNQEPKVEQLVKQLKRDYTDNKYVYGFLAMNYTRKKQESETIETLYLLIKIDPGNIQQRMTLANILSKKGQLKEALRLYDEVISLTPRDPQPLLKKGYILLKQKEFKQVSELADIAEKQFPELSVSKLLLTEMAIIEKKYDKAVEYFIQSYTRQKNLRNLYTLVDTLIAADKEYEAYQLLKKLLVIDNSDAGVHLKLASLYQRNGKTNKSIQHYKIILEIDKTSIIALNNLAWIYAMQGNPQGLVYARQAYEQSPTSINVMDTYGYVMLKLGDQKEALLVLEKAAGRAEKKGNIQIHLAEAYIALGRKSAAKEVLQKLLTDKKMLDQHKQAEDMLSRL